MKRTILMTILLAAAGTAIAAPPKKVRDDEKQKVNPPPENPGKVQAKDSKRQPPRSDEVEETLEECGKDDSHEDGVDHIADAGDGAPHKVNFSVKFRDEVSAFRLISTVSRPGEKMIVEVVLSDEDDVFVARADGGKVKRLAEDKWQWTAPKKSGVYCLEIEEKTSGERACLQNFVTVPYAGEAKLNGYRIGEYKRPLRGSKAYARPDGFVEVTKKDYDRWVSPHFQLRQFLCKQNDGPPQYVLISARLLLKLELILEEVNRRGIKADSFYVMSGYRTPYYNKAIGNTTVYSRHSYGDAADIFIDQDRNGRMDDIDGDGKVTEADAKRLFDIVDGLAKASWYGPFVGGLGLYGPKPHRGPFIHVDTRGRRARW